MIQVLHLAEIVLWSRDLERSLAFYQDLFGLELISPPELPNKFLRAGPGEGPVPEMIVLVPHPDPEGAFSDLKEVRPLHHLARKSTASSGRLGTRCCLRSYKPFMAGGKIFGSGG